MNLDELTFLQKHAEEAERERLERALEISTWTHHDIKMVYDQLLEEEMKLCSGG